VVVTSDDDELDRPEDDADDFLEPPRRRGDKSRW